MKLLTSLIFILTFGLILTFSGEVSYAQGSSSNGSESATDDFHWYKGNLHTHSLWSDGTEFPEVITQWYASRDYNFLAMTDHNILSEGEKWMALSKIVKRGGDKILTQYKNSFPGDWVETRGEGDKLEVKLKTLEQYRTKFESPGKFLLLTGEEISDRVAKYPVHMNATNLAKVIRPVGGQSVREAMTNNLRAAQEQAKAESREIIVHLNHPNFGWAVTAEDLAFVTLENFFEIYNGHPGVNQLGDKSHPSVERLWDIANTIRIAKMKSKPLLGLGTDDCHEYHGRPGSQPGRGWIMVRAKKLTPENLTRAINEGEFYSSSGVVLDEAVFDIEKRELTIQVAPVDGETYTTQFIGTTEGYDETTSPRELDGVPAERLTRNYSQDVGRVLATVEGNVAKYQFKGNEFYVRAVVSSSAAHPNPSIKGQVKQAWTQPVGWEKWVE